MEATYLWLIHVDVWQKPTQYCKAIILQFKKQIEKKRESACNAEDTGDLGSIHGWGRSSGGGNDNSLQYSHLKNPMDRGA